MVIFNEHVFMEGQMNSVLLCLVFIKYQKKNLYFEKSRLYIKIVQSQIISGFNSCFYTNIVIWIIRPYSNLYIGLNKIIENREMLRYRTWHG